MNLTEDSDKKWCVYIHTSPSNKKYVGITSKSLDERSGYNGNGYKKSNYFYNAISKYGWDSFKHEIVCEHLSYSKAQAMEQNLIVLYKSNNRKFGYNMTSGGEGIKDYKHSDITKDKIRKAITGRKHSQESIIKQRVAKIGHNVSIETKEKISKKLTNVKLSNKTREKMSIAKQNMSRETIEKAARGHYKSILQFDLKGNYLATYDSIKEIVDNYGFADCNISLCCHKKINISNGYIWRFEKEYKKLDYKNDNTIIRNEIEFLFKQTHIKRSVHRHKQIEQYSLDGDFIQKYDSLSEASINTNTSISGTSLCCNNKQKTANNFKWRFANGI